MNDATREALLGLLTAAKLSSYIHHNPDEGSSIVIRSDKEAAKVALETLEAAGCEIELPAQPPCLSMDLYHLEPRSSHLLCSKPIGHEDDHGNELYSWPRSALGEVAK